MKSEKFILYNTAFKVGFVTGTSLLVLINILVYLMLLYEFYYQEDERFTSTITIHLIYNVGIPFPMYFWTDYSHEGRFIMKGFVANVFSIFIISFLIGLLFRFIWSKFKSKQLK